MVCVGDYTLWFHPYLCHFSLFDNAKVIIFSELTKYFMLKNVNHRNKNIHNSVDINAITITMSNHTMINRNNGTISGWSLINFFI